MFPTLISFSGLTISSFGFFLALGFLFATFLVWRLSRAWDLNEEKILDLCLLTFFGALLGARLLFVLLHLNLFDNVFNTFLLTKYPGLELWGGIIGGSLALYFFARRMKRIDFWQVADLAAVGLLGGLILGNIGCFLGGCNVGIRSDFLSVSMVGYVGKRFPLQILEALVFSFVLFRIWPVAVKFHFTGKIVSLTLISFAVIEFLLEFLKAEKTGGLVFSPIVLALGVLVFYRLGKRNIKADLASFWIFFTGIFTSTKVRNQIKNKFSKAWYNQRTAWKWSAYQLKKRLRRARVKTSTPSDF